MWNYPISEQQSLKRRGPWQANDGRFALVIGTSWTWADRSPPLLGGSKTAYSRPACFSCTDSSTVAGGNLLEDGDVGGGPGEVVEILGAAPDELLVFDRL